MSRIVESVLKRDHEQYRVPRTVRDVIPIDQIWNDGIFRCGNKFTKTFRFVDINYSVASREDQEVMFLSYSELLNSLDNGCAAKITISNHRMNRQRTDVQAP